MLITEINEYTDEEIESQINTFQKRIQNQRKAVEDLLVSCLRHFDNKEKLVNLKNQLIDTRYHYLIYRINLIILTKYRHKIFIYQGLELDKYNREPIENMIKEFSIIFINNLVQDKKKIYKYLKKNNVSANLKKYYTNGEYKNSDCGLIGLYGRRLNIAFGYCSKHKCFLNNVDLRLRKCDIIYCTYFKNTLISKNGYEFLKYEK